MSRVFSGPLTHKEPVEPQGGIEPRSAPYQGANVGTSGPTPVDGFPPPTLLHSNFAEADQRVVSDDSGLCYIRKKSYRHSIELAYSSTIRMPASVIMARRAPFCLRVVTRPLSLRRRRAKEGFLIFTSFWRNHA